MHQEKIVNLETEKKCHSNRVVETEDIEVVEQKILREHTEEKQILYRK